MCLTKIDPREADISPPGPLQRLFNLLAITLAPCANTLCGGTKGACYPGPYLTSSLRIMAFGRQRLLVTCTRNSNPRAFEAYYVESIDTGK